MNSALAQTTLLHLARLGVREVCVAAGARNTPLITALLASQGVRVWHFFEERCAAYFALGRMMISRRPVAVFTTSGTAAAELLPAVIEAFYQGQPLVLVTADRPSRYRGSGAPQAIEQVGLFGSYALPTLDLEGSGADAAWPKALTTKPLHVNVCLDEPLVGESAALDFAAWDELENLAQQPNRAALPDPAFAPPNPAKSRRLQRQADGGYSASRPALLPDLQHSDAAILEAFAAQRNGLIVLASGLHPAEAALIAPRLAELGVPIIAEATANLHAYPALESLLVAGGEKALRTAPATRVLRIGGVPSWRWWRDLEQRPEINVLHVSRTSFPGLARWEGVGVLPLAALATAQLTPPTTPQTNARATIIQLSAALGRNPLAEPAWMEHLANVIPNGSTVMLGNSLPIREWNLTASAAAQPTTTFYANRGANGIDGLVSTFLGLAASHSPSFHQPSTLNPQPTPSSWLILGDLSALYDLAAPWILNQLPPGHRRIVVINNGGGKIFSRVESLRALPDQARAVIENRHTQSFQPWADLWNISYRLATQPSDLAELPDGDIIIEVRPVATQTEAFWAEWQP